MIIVVSHNLDSYFTILDSDDTRLKYNCRPVCVEVCMICFFKNITKLVKDVKNQT